MKPEKSIYGVIFTPLLEAGAEKDSNDFYEGSILMEDKVRSMTLERARERAKVLSSRGHAVVVRIEPMTDEYVRGKHLASVLPF